MTVRRSLGALCFSLLVLTTAVAQHPRVSAPPSPAAAPTAAPSGVESLDLHGPPDTTPLSGEEQNPTPYVTSPPQTVEGTITALDSAGKWVEVNTLGGPVKIGLPENVPYVRNGERQGSFSDLKLGDELYATVVTQNGPRAVYVVTDAPYNPWITWLGVPALLLVALWIWQTGRTRPEVTAKVAARGEPTT